MKKNNKEVKKTIIELLNSRKTKDQLEIIANVLIEIGIEHIDTDNKEITVNDITDIVIKDIKKHGDTLPNSIVRQGLTMLLWLKK